jgi:hypothetical protein
MRVPQLLDLIIIYAAVGETVVFAHSAVHSLGRCCRLFPADSCLKLTGNRWDTEFCAKAKHGRFFG